jgi:hypothetical protein
MLKAPPAHFINGIDYPPPHGRGSFKMQTVPCLIKRGDSVSGLLYWVAVLVLWFDDCLKVGNIGYIVDCQWLSRQHLGNTKSNKSYIIVIAGNSVGGAKRQLIGHLGLPSLPTGVNAGISCAARYRYSFSISSLYRSKIFTSASIPLVRRS